MWINELWNANVDMAAKQVASGLLKAQMKQQLNLAQSDREREHRVCSL